MTLTMIIYRKDLQEMFEIMRASWSKIEPHHHEDFLHRHKIGQIYFIAHTLIQTLILGRYFVFPYLFNDGRLLIQISVPG